MVLRKIIAAIDTDDDCLALLFNAWFLDDGVLAGKKSAILHALFLIGTLGPPLGLHINLSNGELFSHNDTNMFPSGMKVSHVPHLVILGAPIGDYLFCASFIASKHTGAMKLLSRLVELSCFDPQIALILLRMCGGYCKLVHLARATPPSLASIPLQLFDAEVRECFAQCTAVPTANLT